MQAASGTAVALVDLRNGATVAQQPQVPAASAENGGGGAGCGGSTDSVTGSSGTAANSNVVTMCQCILVLDPFPTQSMLR